jgi:four helix bundle protein
MTNKPLSSYRELIAWQKSVDLVTEIYPITEEFPRDEIYGLTSQLRRSAVSVPSNIAEVARILNGLLTSLGIASRKTIH